MWSYSYVFARIMIKIAINGFGRIGRSVFRKILDREADLEVAAINDLTDTKTLSHLLRYDSLYGVYKREISCKENSILVDKEKIPVFAKKDPSDLHWKELGVDVVLECTGFFTDKDGAGKHLSAGAKKVIISAPSKSPEISTFVLGVNEEKYNQKEDDIISNASCTTNCLAPVVDVLHQNFEIEEGFMTTIHSYTSDQRILDAPHKDLRRARAAAVSIIPTTTGAAKTVTKVIPELEGKLDGIALRVPTPTVSVVDFVARVKKQTTREEVNYIFKNSSKEERYRGILGIEDAKLVSIDYKGNSFSAVVDSDFTMVRGNLVKIIAWYDNEWGYACRLAEIAEFVGKKLNS